MNIMRMRDPTDDHLVAHPLLPLPFKLAICGKSQLSGKTTLTANLLLRPEFYYKYWKPANIFLFSPSADTYKWKTIIDKLDIPDSNIFNAYDGDILSELYDELVERYKDTPEQSLIIFDDCGFDDSLRSRMIDKIASNSRHYLISSILICQKYTQLSTCYRENLTGCVLYEATEKQLNLIEHDFCFGSKKSFRQMFTECTKEARDFLFINMTKPRDQRFSHSFGASIDLDSPSKSGLKT